MSTEAATRADFSQLRYAQVWEDADVLLAGLDIRPDDVCLSIASAGDNALAMLGAGAARVIAVDLNPAQLACLALRVAAYQELEHEELLELLGSRPSQRREELYQRCRGRLDAEVRAFWDGQRGALARGFGGAGKFERYFECFRQWVLPLVHRSATVDRLLRGGDDAARWSFFSAQWDTWQWRLIFRLFFSRWVMGALGRDRAFFHYVHGSVAGRMLARTGHALTDLDPAQNPYLHWILTGTHGTALPWALRPENFLLIRSRLNRLEWHRQSLEDFLASGHATRISKFNLSDIFEYMSADNCQRLLARIVAASRPGGRLAYWNLLAPRSRSEALADRLRPRREQAAALHRCDKAWFYSAFVLEEVV